MRRAKNFLLKLQAAKKEDWQQAMLQMDAGDKVDKVDISENVTAGDDKVDTYAENVTAEDAKPAEDELSLDKSSVEGDKNLESTSVLTSSDLLYILGPHYDWSHLPPKKGAKVLPFPQTPGKKITSLDGAVPKREVSDDMDWNECLKHWAEAQHEISF